MLRRTFALLLLAALAPVYGQRTLSGEIEIRQALEKLNTLGSVMMIAAHPDDLEFVMAGTLLRLKERGWEIHCFNLSTGNCGSVEFGEAKTRRVRLATGQLVCRR